METTHARPPPPKVTSSMLAAAGQMNDNGTTSSTKASLVKEDHDDDDALIPEIEEIQSDEHELPTTPKITKEMLEVMYPPLPTMQELDAALEKFQNERQNLNRETSLIPTTKTAPWMRSPPTKRNQENALLKSGKRNETVGDRWFVDNSAFDSIGRNRIRR